MTDQQEMARGLNRTDDERLGRLAPQIDSAARNLAGLFEEYKTIKRNQRARSKAAGLSDADHFDVTDAAQLIFWLLRRVPGVPEAKPEFRESNLPQLEARSRRAREAA